MFDELVSWLEDILPNYQMSRGMFIDSPALYGSYICSVTASGGAAIDVDVRRPRYRVVLIGPRNGRQYADEVQADAEKIMAATQDPDVPCGIAIIWAMGEPIGPGYTTENRAHMQLDLQVTL